MWLDFGLGLVRYDDVFEISVRISQGPWGYSMFFLVVQVVPSLSDKISLLKFTIVKRFKRTFKTLTLILNLDGLSNKTINFYGYSKPTELCT